MSESLLVRGGKALSGAVTPSGNKNAVLPMLCATLLTDETMTVRNAPDITDVNKIVDFFLGLGSRVEWDRDAKTIEVNHSGADLNARSVIDSLPLRHAQFRDDVWAAAGQSGHAQRDR